jgi:predicted MPP superfamily phosphohydrolase
MSEVTKRLVLFLGVATLLVGGVHVYLYRRLVRDLTTRRRWRIAGLVVLSTLALLLLSARVLLHRIPGGVGTAIATGVWTWFGLVAYLLMFLWSADLLSGSVRLWRWGAAKLGGQAPVPVDESRRVLLSRAIAGGAAVVTGGMGVYGTWRTFEAPLVSEVAVKIPNLPRALDGFTIVQVSDIHVGGIVRRRFLDEMVQRCNALRPDLVAITGDLVDGEVDALAPSIAALRELKGRYGSYFVSGNHEYYSGWEEWAPALESMGIGVLRNRRVKIGDAGASFDLAGVDDWGRRGVDGYDLDRALAGRDSGRAGVLLCHQPVEPEAAFKRGIGLQLSGHTHGGQMFPGTLLVGLRWQYSRGLYRVGDGALYVHRGTGFWGPPMRVGSPPEIAKITLVA